MPSFRPSRHVSCPCLLYLARFAISVSCLSKFSLFCCFLSCPVLFSAPSGRKNGSRRSNKTAMHLFSHFLSPPLLSFSSFVLFFLFSLASIRGADCSQHQYSSHHHTRAYQRKTQCVSSFSWTTTTTSLRTRTK